MSALSLSEPCDASPEPHSATAAPSGARRVLRPMRLPSTTEHVLLLRDGWAATHQRGVYAHTDGRRAWWTLRLAAWSTLTQWGQTEAAADER